MTCPAPVPTPFPRAALPFVLLLGTLGLNAMACSSDGGQGEPQLGGDAGIDASGPSDPGAGKGEADASSQADASNTGDAAAPDGDDGAGPDAPDANVEGGEGMSSPTLERIAGPTQMLVKARATLTLWLDRAAESATLIQLSAAEGLSLAATTVEISAGALFAGVEIEAGDRAREGIAITATLGGASLSHAIDLLESAAAPAEISLRAAPDPIEKGESASLTILLDAPASKALDVALSADCGSLETAITIPSGVNAAVTDFDARGCSGERATLTAKADGLAGDEITLGIQSAGGGLVLNQIMTRGNNADAEFIELFNGSASAIDLSPFVLWYGGAQEARPGINLNAVKNFSLSGRSIAAKGHFLIAFKGALKAFEDVVADIAVDAAGGFNDEMGGSIWLTASDEAPTLESEDLVDLVGWGSAAAFEGHAAALSPSEENSAIKRQPDGQDTGDNAEDFVWLESATPRSSMSR